MPLNVNPYYKELCAHMNPYLATMQMAEDTREVCRSLSNRITVSTALDYVAKGITPNPKDFPDHRLDRVKEYLKCVDDLGVKSAVIKSYEQSLYKDNLVYDYNNIEDEPRQSRVRIIMNILWDKRPHRNR